jgi:hypothetical protein
LGLNVLDENILASQRQLLRSWRIPIRQIGVELGRKGMSDEYLIPLLLKLPNPTFFTRDSDFTDQDLCHKKLCLAVLEVQQYDVAHFIRRFLRHPEIQRSATTSRFRHPGLAHRLGRCHSTFPKGS